MPTVFWVLLAGTAGVFCRYAAGRLLEARWVGGAPWPIFFVNLGGCLLIGIVYALFFDAKRNSTPLGLNPVLGTALITGFLGGFTTFSSYSLDTILLWENGRRLFAFTYAILSPAVGILSALAGLTLTRFIFSK